MDLHYSMSLSAPMDLSEGRRKQEREHAKMMEKQCGEEYRQMMLIEEMEQEMLNYEIGINTIPELIGVYRTSIEDEEWMIGRQPWWDDHLSWYTSASWYKRAPWETTADWRQIQIQGGS